MRLIDAEELLHSMCCLDIETQCDAEDCIRYKERKYIEAAPTIEVEPVNRWIPCRERLPEYGKEVLVWFEYFRYGEYNRMYQTHGIGEFFGKHGKHESWLINHETGWQKLKVFAWMPLPESPERDGE